MHRSKLTMAITAITATLALGACAHMPLPANVDLLAKMPAETAEGEITQPVQAGTTETVDVRLPTEEGQCLDFSEVAPGVTVQSAKLQWIVDATYQGPDLTGKLQARAYAAGAGDAVFSSNHTVGPVFTIKLDRTRTRLAGAAVLNPTQLQAVNDRVVCFGVDVSGRDVAALEDGTLTIDYSVKQLKLSITFSVM